MIKCKNCEQPLKEEDKFCSNCGQKSIEHLKARTLLGELASTFFAWDSKLFKTLKLLLFRPGHVSLNYIQGKRKGYVAPIRLYFFFSVLFFLALSTLGTRLSADEGGEDLDMFSMSFEGDTSSIQTDTLLLMDKHGELDNLQLIQEQESEFMKTFLKQVIRVSLRNGSFLSFLQKNVSFMFFVFIPVFGWILKLFYRRKKLDYIEHLVFGLYFHSFLFFILFITLLLAKGIGQGWPILAGILILIIYFGGGLKKFYAGSWGSTIIKCFFIIVVYLILFTVFALSTVGLTIWFY